MKRPRRVAVVGSRTFNDYNRLARDLDRCREVWGAFVILTGGAKGTDSLAIRYAEERGVLLEMFWAEWSRYGKAAGPIRNRTIANSCDVLIAFWDGASPGTRDVIEQTRALGKRVWVREFQAAPEGAEAAEPLG